MPKTRVKDRDSSRRDRKAPGNVLQRTPQPRPANVVHMRPERHGQLGHLRAWNHKAAANNGNTEVMPGGW
jgi:hypothetical protein